MNKLQLARVVEDWLVEAWVDGAVRLDIADEPLAVAYAAHARGTPLPLDIAGRWAYWLQVRREKEEASGDIGRWQVALASWFRQP